MFYFLRKVLCSQYAFLKSTFKLFFWHLKWFAALHCKNIRLEIHSRVVRHPWSLHSLVMWRQHFLIMAYWSESKRSEGNLPTGKEFIGQKKCRQLLIEIEWIMFKSPVHNYLPKTLKCFEDFVSMQCVPS